MQQKSRVINETIKPLSDDDMLKLFKATLQSPSLAQIRQTAAVVARRAMDVRRRWSQNAQPLNVEPEVDLLDARQEER